ncbi:hypothetical protein FQN54_000212 [Arachnomyces sp. PD_36]|nr:hypothetical protein FQN54_000212 [Arachnomyces sp. PD_36]
MADQTDTQPRFYDYPSPKQGPSVPYKNKPESNPVLRGLPLAIGASLVHSLGFVQSFFYGNAGFSVLRDIKELDGYVARYDPTVIPARDPSAKLADLPVPAATSAAATQERNGQRVAYRSAADYRALYLSGELTPTSVAETLLPLIRRDISDPTKHATAFLESNVELVLAAAAASTLRYKEGKSLGPLDGVPVAVKDEVDITGYKTTLGSSLDFTDKEGRTSWCVKKWMEAGAVIVGKTNMHELGLDTTNNNPHRGTPRNPHNSGYYTGGSSGGSGYAVGAGLVPIALGADGGGSIRLPSSYCGIYGLKPSHGRISGEPTQPAATTTGVLGPMACNIDDLALAYRIMATPDPNNTSSSSFPHPLTTLPTPESTSTRPKIIGIVPAWIERADPDVRSLFNKAIDHYRTSQNYKVVEIDIPFIPEGQKAHVLTILTEISSAVKNASRKGQTSLLSSPNKILISVGGTQATAQELLSAQKLRNLLMKHLAYLFKKYPGLIIATPTSPLPGSKIANQGTDLGPHGVSDSNASIRSMEYVYMANFTGCPAINCPVGYLKDSHVPVGIMGMGEWGSEEELLEWGRDGEAVLDFGAAAAPAKSSNGAGATTAEAGSSVEEEDDDGVLVGKGLKIPETWVDVVSEAAKRQGSAKL